MDETISADSRDFETNVDLAPNRSLPEPAAISVQKFAKRHYKISGDLVSRLDKASRNEGVEASSFLLAAFTVVLNRYVQADLSEIANAAQTFGDLARSFPDDTSVQFDGTCIEREVTLSDFPKALGTSTASRCKALFTWSVSDHFESQDVDLRFRCQGLRGNDSELQVVIDIDYRESWWTQDWIDRMFGHLATALSVGTLDSDTPIADTCILTEKERSELLVGFNDTAKDYPRDVCVHELFEQQVQRTPDAVALVFEDQQLTYAELNARANRLARYLRSKGVGIETPVGMCLERSLDLVISILGILKAGATYVPLDAEYPTKRLEHMLRLARIGHLVTQSDLIEKLPKTDRIDICIDTDTNQIANQESEDLELELDSGNLAYVIFTSGSTGAPKGVMIEHASIVNLLLEMISQLELNPSHHFLCATNPIFDASVWELLSPLLCGSRLEIASPITISDPVRISGRLSEGDVTHFQATPSRLQMLFQAGWKGEGNLVALSGGESLNLDLLSRLKGNCKAVWNLYGPTESTCQSSILSFESNLPASCIGRPIANTQVYVLDTHQQLVPIGVPGELYIGGDGLARGYLNRPDLTAERFVLNPFSQDPNSRLYRTGDLCRWRVDGNLEYLGRIDHQVKLRGFRIELGEIESTLVSHPAIAQCVVILREDRPGDKRLVAYYTASGETLPKIAQLREHLQASLPEYMIPSAFVLLDALPLTPSGKIDRRALPAPDLKGLDTQENYTPPRNGIEEQFVEIWQEILGIERIGIHDNFFALGGHSLLAARLIVTIRDRFAMNLPFKVLFSNPTIAETASRIIERDVLIETVAQPDDSIDDGIDWTLDRIPASYAQRSLFLIDQMFGRQVAYNIPLAWKIDGPLNVEALRESILRVVQNHQPLRTVYSEDSYGIWQEVRSVESWDLPILNLTHEPTDLRLLRALEWMDKEGQIQFDLKTDLPIRSTLIKVSESSHVLFLVFHHIAIDGWSTENLKRELGHTYDQVFLNGLCSTTTPKKNIPSARYRDYTREQYRYMQGDSIQRDRLYWKDQLSDSRNLELPTDFKRPSEFTFRGDYVGVKLSVDLCERIDRFCKDHGCTQHALLLTVFQLLLATQSGQTDILTAVPVGARDNSLWEDLLGYFINVTPIRLQIDRTVSFATHVQRVQSTSASAYDHRRVPFELVVSDTCREVSSDRNPLVQSLFQLIDLESQELRFGTLDVKALDLPLPGSRFDLELNLHRNLNTLTGESCIQGYLYYCSDLWDKSTIASWAKRFTNWLDRLLDSPQIPIASVDLISKDELSELNQLESGISVAGHLEKTFIELFEQQASNRLDSIALSDGNHSMTYGELQARSQQIAVCLVERGIAVGSRVAVLMDRSCDSIASLLGIWKAGGVYLPLDPSYPKGRLNYFIQDSQPSALICTRELIGTIDFPAEKTIVLEPQIKLPRWNDLDGFAFPSVDLEDQAYLLYTSGSTGEPKGVQMPHRVLANLIGWQNTQERLSTAARTLQFAPSCFDVSIQEIASTLTVGGTLVLIDESRRIDPQSLVDFIETNDIERVFLPYVMIDAMVAAAKPGQLNRLRDIVSAGESLRLSARLRDFLFTHLDCILHNHYGPTETHVVTESMIRLDSFDVAAEAHIGRPLPNCICVILDENGHRVPRGAIGELFISGACLATGYANKPQMTAERFAIRDDLSRFNRKWYRTGDLARWRYDGNLDFLGRGDHQVKLRGFRIELGEIESTLARHSSIAQCVVILREDRPGDKRLVAYYTASGETLPSIAQLREQVQASLPEYMIPSAFVLLDALPLTASGKIDRRGLPAPDLKDVNAQEHYTPPRNGIEEQLVEIWQEILDIERIGIHDNFFALGGHSLMAVRLTSRVSDVFNVQLGVRQVFANPSIAKQAQQIEVMRSGDHKEANIRLRRNSHEVGQAAPLSHAQERLWFLEQLEGSLTAYNIPMSWRIRGSLDTEALRKSLEAIVLRHEPLRTIFKHDGAMPVQIVQPLVRFDLTLVDLQGVDPQAKEHQLEQSLLSEANGAFDLKCDLMIRARLLRLDDHEHVLLLTMHHIASDGWSIDVLSRELSTLYRYFLDTPDGSTNDVTGLLDPLPLNYIDYTLWQRQNLSEHRIEGLLEYWREELKDLPALELPTDRPRPAVASYQGSSVEVNLPNELISNLETLCKSEQVTLQMLLLAAFETLLYRYSHQEDFAVGIPFAGREDSQLEDLIGFFVSTLLIRADLSGEPTFQELLSRVRQKSLAAYDHQALPLQVLLADLQPERHLSRPPLFQVMFQLLNRDEAGLKLPGLEVAAQDHRSNRVKFDLELHLSRHTGDISGAFYYSTDLFDSETIQRMALHYVRLLESIAANPNQKVSQLEILTDQERTELVVGFNDTAKDYPRDLCVHELFEQQVQRTPDAVALVFEDQQLTYAELNARANRLARHLRSQGVGIETPVGVCLKRSLDLVVSILGILKAGASYVPLDAEYPKERTLHMIGNTNTYLVLTQRSVLDRVNYLPKPLCIEEVAETSCRGLEICESLPKVPIESIAYVIHTSGSTGIPKGVAVSQSSLVNLLSWADGVLFTDVETALMGVAPATFDISLAEFLAPLLAGKTTVFTSKEIARDPTALIEQIALQYNCVVQATPATWVSLLDIGWNGRGCRTAVSTGEALPASVRSKLLQLGLRVLDLYGPTETTIWSTYREVHGTDNYSCIGRPIANTQVYVLDANQQLVPVGVPGELYIGGDGLARGYLNRPDLTAERFVPNPFSQDRNSRLYRTGDLCLWRVDGNIEYLGRIDHQVKLRGFRIELGEIESTLASHPAIAQCVVTLREDRPGDKRLVAYYTATGEILPSIAQLREHLQTSLPEYMIPSAFVLLDALPLTPSGKIDRRGLPAPDLKDLDAQEHYTPPRNGMEEQLVEIWQEILGIERIGIHDNFFTLGGHSLLAVRLTSRVSDVFNVQLGVRQVFENPSIAKQAQHIEAMRSGDQNDTSIRLVHSPLEVGQPAPLSHAQERLWFLEQLEGSLTAYNIPMSWRIRGNLDTEALRNALEAIVLRHEPLRTTFKHDGTTPVQIVQQLDRFELPVMDLRELDPSAKKLQVEQALLSEANGAFDLKCDLMIRARLLRLEDYEYELLLTMHHIASDGWSIDVLSRELSRLYRHFQDVPDGPTDDLSSLLEPLPVNYIDYTFWQRENLSEHRIEGLLNYWRKELKDLPALELPTDRPRPSTASYQGSSIEVKLPEDLISKLESLCSSEQVTLQMLLLAAFESLLYRYSHQNDFAVGIPFAGREDSQLEDLIGFFVSTLVIRADLSGEPTFQELLTRVRQKSLAAYDHQALPLQVLLADLQPERHLSRPPLFQVMFQLLSRNQAGLTLPGLEVTDEDHGSNRVKFDLELHLSRHTGDISGAFHYSTELFDSETIQRMALHYVRLLESIAANPNQKVSQLEILTDQERTELLVGFNDTATDYPRDLCVHVLFEQQVQKTPDAVALVFEDQQLTYSELNTRANRLARHLRSQGVGIETPVGMCLERSLDLVVSILGILKAGASYVPLDAEYPTKRLEHMLGLARIGHLVTQSGLLEKLPKTDRIDICIDTDTNQIANQESEDLELELNSGNLAYVIFTSGSTGAPKGVMIEHASATNLLVDMADRLDVGSTDRVLSVTTPTFDISILEFLVPLLTGGSVDIASKNILNDSKQLIERLDTSAITWMQSTPSRWELLLNSGWKGERRLKVLSGGEPLSDFLANRLRNSCGRLWNVYGPTETTIWSTGIETVSGETSNCIGRPIANTQVLVLTSNQQLVPIGVPGELYIGGDCLARGYLNRPDLTAERFVPNPFSQDPSSRLYRTGDLCRWRVDGNIEYLGRIDHQVKLRGFRIELGEIESTLASHPAIAQCVVILREDRPGDKRLVAYYTASGEILPSIAQLREQLQASLPEYMIPSAFVLLDALPLTPSGKIDRRELPAPDLKDVNAQEQHTPPRNGIEEQLVEIWQEILGIERIGIHDNFFALGGHSLLAVRLFNTINQRFQKTLPLSLIFQCGSIAQIASSLVQASDESAIARVVRLSSGSSGPKLIVMPGLTGQLLYALKLVERLESRFDIYGLEPHLSMDHLETFGDFCRLASEYLKIILKHQPRGPYNFVGYSYGGILGYEIARQLQQLGHRIDFIGVIDTGPNSQSPSKDLQSVANHWMRVGSNLPGWIGANCGPEKLKETLKKGSRRFRYWARCFLSQGKTEYRFEDEFGARRSHNDRHEILSRIFQAFNGYRPKAYRGRVTLFRASVRPLLHSLSPDLGWSSVVQEVRVHRIPGDHDTIIEAAGLNQISDLMLSSENCNSDA